MPAYVFQCRECGAQSEVKCPYRERPASQPCSCGGTQVPRPQAPGLVFKGPGFACNDLEVMRKRRSEQLGVA